MRVGLFGGTFDPPHVGHLVVAADAYRALALDRMLIVPSAVHPFKAGRVRTSAALRAEMVSAAIAGDDRMELESTELQRPGPSFTVDTLREVRQRLPDAELFLLIGADNLREIADWREPDDIRRLARLAVLSRAGETGRAEAAMEFVPVPVTRVDLSSTEVRRRAAAGESIRYLVPEAVRAIIERESLYGAA